jgi:hypothetical protein
MYNFVVAIFPVMKLEDLDANAGGCDDAVSGGVHHVCASTSPAFLLSIGPLFLPHRKFCQYVSASKKLYKLKTSQAVAKVLEIFLRAYISGV